MCVMRFTTQLFKSRELLGREETLSQNYFLLQFSSEKLELSSIFEYKKIKSKKVSKHKLMGFIDIKI